MNQDALKHQVAAAALQQIPDDIVLGVGTGSTVNAMIRLMCEQGKRLAGCVSSSKASSALLREGGYEVMDLNSAGELALYVDGADECDPNRCLIKGGGAALTREKIIAAASKRFVCIIDASKQVDVLGAFPLPVEVIPMARSHVARQLLKLGGEPVWRENVITDNGNQIIDVGRLAIHDPPALEDSINGIAGVVTVGLFARRPADQVLVATADGVVSL